MKKLILGAVVGGIIMFIWQFLSWGLLNLHYSQNSYTSNQDEIYDFVRNKLPEGEYMIPTVPKGASAEDQAALQERIAGQPWMQIKYHEKWQMSMGMNMTRGVIMNIISIFLLCWILAKIPNLSMGTAIISSLFVGLIGYFVGPYTNSIWFETATIPDLIDTIVQFGLVGAWLGFILRRGES